MRARFVYVKMLLSKLRVVQLLSCVFSVGVFNCFDLLVSPQLYVPEPRTLRARTCPIHVTGFTNLDACANMAARVALNCRPRWVACIATLLDGMLLLVHSSILCIQYPLREHIVCVMVNDCYSKPL